VKLFTTIGILIWTASLSFGQNDATAEALLDQSAKAWANAGGISASFSLNIKNTAANTSESFEGALLMQGDKFFLSTPETDTWFDGKTQWTLLKSSSEVNVSEPTKEERQIMIPSSLFDAYKKKYHCKYTGEQTDIKGRTVHEVELTPRKKTEIIKIGLQIGKKNHLPTSIAIFNKNKINSRIYILKYQTGQHYPDQTFVFDPEKHPQTEIIDLR
jgi:outer membrane lipoprotein-sorting protein